MGYALLLGQAGSLTSANYGWSLIKMLLALVVVCVLAYLALRFGLKAPRAPYSPPPGYSDLCELVHLKMMAKGQFYARRGMINLSLPVTDSMFEDFASDLIATLDMCSDAIVETVSP